MSRHHQRAGAAQTTAQTTAPVQYIAQQTHFGDSFQFGFFGTDARLKAETEAVCNALQDQTGTAVYAAFPCGQACLFMVTPGKQNRRHTVEINVYRILEGGGTLRQQNTEAERFYHHLLTNGAEQPYITTAEDSVVYGAMLSIAPYVFERLRIPVRIINHQKTAPAEQPVLTMEEIPLFAAAYASICKEQGSSNQCLKSALSFTRQLHGRTAAQLLEDAPDTETLDRWHDVLLALSREHRITEEDVDKMRLLLYLYGKLESDYLVRSSCTAIMSNFAESGILYLETAQNPKSPVHIDRLEKLFRDAPSALHMNDTLRYYRDTENTPCSVDELMVRLFLRELAGEMPARLFDTLTHWLADPKNIPLRMDFLRALGSKAFCRRLENMGFFHVQEFLTALYQPGRGELKEKYRVYALWLYFHLLPIPETDCLLGDNGLRLIYGEDDERLLEDLILLLKERRNSGSEAEKQKGRLLRQKSRLYRRAMADHRKEELSLCRAELQEAKETLRNLHRRQRFWRWRY